MAIAEREHCGAVGDRASETCSHLDQHRASPRLHDLGMDRTMIDSECLRDIADICDEPFLRSTHWF